MMMQEDSTKPKRKPIIKALINIGIIILGMAAIYFGFTFSLGTSTPFYVVSSGSMIPALTIGDIIIVNGDIDFDELNIGDIIVFDEPKSGSKVIVHRVKEIHEASTRQIVTKGDNNLASDDWLVTSEDFLGGVIFAIPRIGYLTTALAPPMNYLLIVVVVATIFLLEIRGNRPEPEELEESDNEMSEDEEDQSFSEILKVFH
ncbi:MAG: signal peptidase I [Nitrososphaerales archaeon]|jgi:signal peptidase|nr:signal peptidase I [Nitrososphaerales archaeon]|tara:strand:+ start:3886 stop:4491 length:606 start_codon:yes stop_codon:yes gene_type:complete